MNRYSVILVDDEPAGLNHMRILLEKKCPEYFIAETAENGVDALKKMEKSRPDVLITDIKMPIMDGIQLIQEARRRYSDMLLVIVSGYSEFEYAKEAIRNGVCDYLMKPLVPSEFKELMNRLLSELDMYYYKKRNVLLEEMCTGNIPDQAQLDRFFPYNLYYAFLLRRNGLPHRFIKKWTVKVFSIECEQYYTYGRDEMETLYLIPAKLVIQKEFYSLCENLYYKWDNGTDYRTGIIYEKAFLLKEFSEIAKRMYRKLDESIVVGVNLLKCMNDADPAYSEFSMENKTLEYIGQLIQNNEHRKLPGEMMKLFQFWQLHKCSQIYMESGCKYIFRILCNRSMKNISYSTTEILIDDLFYNATNIEELSEGILNLMKQCDAEFPEELSDNREQLFYTIVSYLNTHLDETLTLSIVCGKFGVSQTSLSSMFRKYEETSFNNYLTKIRIEKAKQILAQEPNVFIREVAERCGYSDQFYFSRIFRTITGICPKDYPQRSAT